MHILPLNQSNIVNYILAENQHVFCYTLSKLDSIKMVFIANKTSCNGHIGLKTLIQTY